MGAWNCATMDSSNARVESVTGRIWLRPKLGGRWGRAWRVRGTDGRGAGFSRVRVGDLEGGGGGGRCVECEATCSVESARAAKIIWRGWRRAAAESILKGS